MANQEAWAQEYIHTHQDKQILCVSTHSPVNGKSIYWF